MKDGSLSELDLVGVLWRHKVWLVACVVFAAVVGYGLSQLLPVRYTAEARVFLSYSTPFDPLGQRSSGNQQRYVVQQAELMSSQAVLDKVTLPLSAPRAELSEAISIAPSSDSDLVIVSATSDDPDLAAALADGVAIAFQSFTAELVAEEAERAVAAVNDPAQAKQILAAAAVYGDGVSVVDRAEVPSSPSEPAPLRNAILLAIFAGLVYALVALLPETRGRSTVKDDKDDDEDDDDGGEDRSDHRGDVGHTGSGTTQGPAAPAEVVGTPAAEPAPAREGGPALMLPAETRSRVD